MFLVDKIEADTRDHRRGLGHGLDHIDARKHRFVREMPGELRFVHGDILDPDPALGAVNLDHLVDQKKRVAVRNDPLDQPDVCRFQCLVHLRPHVLKMRIRWPDGSKSAMGGGSQGFEGFVAIREALAT